MSFIREYKFENPFKELAYFDGEPLNLTDEFSFYHNKNKFRKELNNLQYLFKEYLNNPLHASGIRDTYIKEEYSENFLRPNSPEIILSWLHGDSYKDINNKYFKNDKVSFSNAVIFCENYIRNFANWISFAINMVLQYKGVGRWKDYLYGERIYIVLSLVAKSILAWLAFGGILQPQ